MTTTDSNFDRALSASWLSTRWGVDTVRINAMRRAGELLAVRPAGDAGVAVPVVAVRQRRQREARRLARARRSARAGNRLRAVERDSPAPQRAHGIHPAAGRSARRPGRSRSRIDSVSNSISRFAAARRSHFCGTRRGASAHRRPCARRSSRSRSGRPRSWVSAPRVTRSPQARCTRPAAGRLRRPRRDRRDPSRAAPGPARPRCDRRRRAALAWSLQRHVERSRAAVWTR